MNDQLFEEVLSFVLQFLFLELEPLDFLLLQLYFLFQGRYFALQLRLLLLQLNLLSVELLLFLSDAFPLLDLETQVQLKVQLRFFLNDLSYLLGC